MVAHIVCRMMVNVQNANGLTVFHSRLQRMKMLAGRGLLFALVGFALAGCGHNELLQIERIMESDKRLFLMLLSAVLFMGVC